MADIEPAFLSEMGPTTRISQLDLKLNNYFKKNS